MERQRYCFPGSFYVLRLMNCRGHNIVNIDICVGLGIRESLVEENTLLFWENLTLFPVPGLGGIKGSALLRDPRKGLRGFPGRCLRSSHSPCRIRLLRELIRKGNRVKIYAIRSMTVMHISANLIMTCSRR